MQFLTIAFAALFNQFELITPHGAGSINHVTSTRSGACVERDFESVAIKKNGNTK